MSDPDIFYFPPKQLPWMDSLFSVFGRALALATRVESGVKSIAGFIDLRLQPDVLDSEQSLRRLTEQISERPLSQAIREFSNRDPFHEAFDQRPTSAALAPVSP
jgi:hypothetical protein